MLTKKTKRTQLLGSEAFKDLFRKSLNDCSESLTLISGFITIPALKWIDENLARDVKRVDLITRWHAKDLINGASDFKSFYFAQEKKWNFSLVHNLHSKLYVFDEMTMFTGSANLTARGFQLSDNHNTEILVMLEALSEDLLTVQRIVNSSTLLDEDMVKDLESHISTIKKDKFEAEHETRWPTSISKKIYAQNDGLWVADLPWDSADELTDHEITLFRLDLDPSASDVKKAFLASKSYAWLLEHMEASKDKTMSFGAISSALHDDLFDDPKPYRKNVKELVQNLISYVEKFASDQIEVTQPNYTKLLKIVRAP